MLGVGLIDPIPSYELSLGLGGGFGGASIHADTEGTLFRWNFGDEHKFHHAHIPGSLGQMIVLMFALLLMLATAFCLWRLAQLLVPSLITRPSEQVSTSGRYLDPHI